MIKIATYNINGINGRLPVLLRWLKEESPDVVCLQELKAPQERFPIQAITDAGYKAVWHGEKSWNGVAVLSKYDITEVSRVLPGDKDDTHSRYLEVIVNQLVICCLYLPNGNPYPGPKFDYKINWIKRLTKRTKALLAMEIPVILIGDFNIIPTEMDTYKPEKYTDNALFRIEVRKAFEDLIAQGWLDTIRKLFPDQKVYTFWDYLRHAYSRNAGLRLDHILLSPLLEDRLLEGGIDRHVRSWEKTSDHAPVWICLKEQ
ncbi:MULTISPECIES: exodeoxyribonuclease III [Sphingobacterium]|uniref:exodeoxyribonuclease III n=1 Tax=Sphingobacterium TaxID=28453 RepID=UPI00038A105D|nr:exodeoxyribonuclease III [Sphingobacterium sp. IITKGP-BTPF85]KKX52181.1 exodeoxyribonuclease III [Sphingobacterium sp. IITKGP-BTPF85]